MTHSIEPLTARAVARLAFELEGHDSGRTRMDVLRRISFDVTDRLRFPGDSENVFENDDAQTAFCSLLKQYGFRDEAIGIDVARQANIFPVSELRSDHYLLQRYL